MTGADGRRRRRKAPSAKRRRRRPSCRAAAARSSRPPRRRASTAPRGRRARHPRHRLARPRRAAARAPGEAVRAPDPPVLPAMELIAVDRQRATPARTACYRRREPDAMIGATCKAARKIKALLLLDIQPGRSDFFTETTRARAVAQGARRRSRARPRVARDGAGQVPGKVIGSVDARARSTRRRRGSTSSSRATNLPQKLFVIHQFTDDMIQEQGLLQPRKSLAIVLNADGFGTQRGQDRRSTTPSRATAPKAFDRLQALLPGGRRT